MQIMCRGRIFMVFLSPYFLLFVPRLDGAWFVQLIE